MIFMGFPVKISLSYHIVTGYGRMLFCVDPKIPHRTVDPRILLERGHSFGWNPHLRNLLELDSLVDEIQSYPHSYRILYVPHVPNLSYPQKCVYLVDRARVPKYFPVTQSISDE